jgi:hypothetical protein
MAGLHICLPNGMRLLKTVLPAGSEVGAKSVLVELG